MPLHRSYPVFFVDGAASLTDADGELLMAAGLARPERLATLHEATQRLAAQPQSVILLPVRGPDPALETFGQVLRSMPETMAIAIAPTRDADAVLAAMRAGIDEFLITPLQLTEVRAALTRVMGRHGETAARHGRLPGRVFTLFSGKGGLGTSTLAASLASALADGGGAVSSGPKVKRVVLVDFTATGAGLRVMLNIDPTHDLSQLQHRSEVIDEPFVRSLLHEHEGISLLVAGVTDAPESLSATTATQLITILRQLFDFVVVDTDRFLSEQTLTALDAADRILIVAQPELMALRSVQQALALCVRLGYRDDAVLVVVNRVTERDRLTVEDVHRILGRPVSATVPNAYRACHEAIAAGAFLPRHVREAALTAAFRALAGTVTGTATAAPPVRHPSRLGALFRRSVRT